MSDDSVLFPRTPYTVTYQDLEGKVQTIRRVPPAKQHDILPTDVVTLKEKRSDDFQAGDQVDVSYISSRNPNVLQVKNNKGEATFVEYFEADLQKEVHPRGGVDVKDQPRNTRYLLWP
jgi:hypothetical protein